MEEAASLYSAGVRRQPVGALVEQASVVVAGSGLIVVLGEVGGSDWCRCRCKMLVVIEARLSP